MRVLVCGGRDYFDRDHIHNTLCNLNATRGPITCVIHGAATGADDECMIWAQMMASVQKIVHAPFPADWHAYGRSAGPRRNQRMIDEGKPDLVVAFPGGRGTADMVKRAKDAKIEVVEIAPRITNVRSISED
jgi:YspA, cpYpsA-related SLOG family